MLQKSFVAHYSSKIQSLKEIFGTDSVEVTDSIVAVDARVYPIVDDVIVLSPPEKCSERVRLALKTTKPQGSVPTPDFATDVQQSFGKEWNTYDRILPEHEGEFKRYFDLIELDQLRGLRVCDLGCGNGRWSYFLHGHCRELVLVDFSDAIFAARKNLAKANNCLFFMADLAELPFRNDFVDFLFCLGVLHHLPTPCLEAARAVRRFAPRTLVFLYYALDNRPAYYRWILAVVTAARKILVKIRHEGVRRLVAKTGAYLIYRPLVLLGKLFALVGLGRLVPLYDFYHDKSAERIEQDVYDRFFTSIEQRVTRKEISSLKDSFSDVTISDKLPYWHFLCVR